MCRPGSPRGKRCHSKVSLEAVPRATPSPRTTTRKEGDYNQPGTRIIPQPRNLSDNAVGTLHAPTNNDVTRMSRDVSYLLARAQAPELGEQETPASAPTISGSSSLANLPADYDVVRDEDGPLTSRSSSKGKAMSPKQTNNATTTSAAGYNLGPNFWVRYSSDHDEFVARISNNGSTDEAAPEDSAMQTPSSSGAVTARSIKESSANTLVTDGALPLAVRLSATITTSAGVLATTPRRRKTNLKKLPPITPHSLVAVEAPTPRVLVSPRFTQRKETTRLQMPEIPLLVRRNSGDENNDGNQDNQTTSDFKALVSPTRTVGNFIVRSAQAANPYRPHAASIRWGVGNGALAANIQARAEEEVAKRAAEEKAERQRRRKEHLEALERERERREILERASNTTASTGGRPSSIADGLRAVVKAVKMRSKGVQTVDEEDMFAGLPKDVQEILNGGSRLVDLQTLLADASPEDLPKIFQRAGDVVASIVGADRSSVFLCDRTNVAWPTLWTLAPVQSVSSQEVARIQIPMMAKNDPTKPHGLAGWCAFNGRGRLIKDAYDMPEFDQSFDKKTGYRTKSVLTAPIMSSKRRATNNVQGVIQCINKKETTSSGETTIVPFTDDDLMLVSAIALFLSKGFEGVHQRRRDKALDSLLESIGFISDYDRNAPLEPDVIYDDEKLFERVTGDRPGDHDPFYFSAPGIATLMAGTLQRILMCERGNFLVVHPVQCTISSRVQGYGGDGVARLPLRVRGQWLTPGTEIVPGAFSDPGDGDDEMDPLEKAGFPVRCVTLAQAVVSHDAPSDKYHDEKMDILTSYKTRTAMCVPIIGFRGNVLGCFALSNKRGMDSYSFTDEDVRLSMMFARMASITMQRDELERELSRSKRLESFMASTLSHMTESAVIEELVERLVLDFRQIVGCEQCALWTFDKLRKNLIREEPIARLDNDRMKGVAVRAVDAADLNIRPILPKNLGELGKEPGVGNDFFNAVPRMPVDLGILGAVARSTAIVNVHRAPTDDRFFGDPELNKAILTIPLIGPNGETAAVVQCTNKTERLEADGKEVVDDVGSYPDDVVTIAARIAGVAGMVLAHRLKQRP